MFRLLIGSGLLTIVGLALIGFSAIPRSEVMILVGFILAMTGMLGLCLMVLIGGMLGSTMKYR